MEFDVAIMHALRRLQKRFGKGWSNTPERTYSRVLVDCRWQTDSVVKAVKATKDQRWRPFMGLGDGHWKKRSYNHPDRKNKSIRWVGLRCYEKYERQHKLRVTFGDANHWKAWLQSRFKVGDDGADLMGIFESVEDDKERHDFARHLSSEIERIKFEKGKGYYREFEVLRSANHWLDSTYMACVAGNRCWHKIRKRRPNPQGAAKQPKKVVDGYSPFAS